MAVKTRNNILPPKQVKISGELHRKLKGICFHSDDDGGPQVDMQELIQEFLIFALSDEQKVKQIVAGIQERKSN